jgi:hypothetical protein
VICICGHEQAAHYDYILNGHDQTRCRECDPHKSREPGNYVMDGDSYEAAMFFAADHAFEPANEK